MHENIQSDQKNDHHANGVVDVGRDHFRWINVNHEEGDKQKQHANFHFRQRFVVEHLFIIYNNTVINK